MQLTVVRSTITHHSSGRWLRGNWIVILFFERNQHQGHPLRGVKSESWERLQGNGLSKLPEGWRQKWNMKDEAAITASFLLLQPYLVEDMAKLLQNLAETPGNVDFVGRAFKEPCRLLKQVLQKGGALWVGSLWRSNTKTSRRARPFSAWTASAQLPAPHSLPIGLWGQESPHTDLLHLCLSCVNNPLSTQQNIISSTKLEKYSNLEVYVLVLASSHWLITHVKGWTLVSGTVCVALSASDLMCGCVALAVKKNSFTISWCEKEIHHQCLKSNVPRHWEILSFRMLSYLNLWECFQWLLKPLGGCLR